MRVDVIGQVVSLPRIKFSVPYMYRYMCVEMTGNYRAYQILFTAGKGYGKVDCHVERHSSLPSYLDILAVRFCRWLNEVSWKS